MHFGFSYIGLIYLVMLMVPNIIWGKNKPKDYEKYVGNERKVFALLEQFDLPEKFAECVKRDLR